MKKILLIILSVYLFSGVFAQNGYKFTDIKRLPTTSVKDQYRSGTCWSFSAISFIESEMLRTGKKATDLSEMFAVYHCYYDKAIKTVRLHGALNFGGGGAFHDVTYVIKKYGMVPESVYNGLNYGEKKHVHGELDKLMKVNVDAVVENPNRKLSTAWKNAIKGILDAYLGVPPQKFTYEGKEYTPRTFADEYVGINPDDYVEITSYTHHPFYSKFVLEIPDNWLWGEVYNVPLNELMEIIDYSLDNGYTVAWAADVSEKYFSYSKGIAVVPDFNPKDLTGTERERWEKLSSQEKKAMMYNLDAPGKEKKITQEMRQEAFDNYQTTDDHGMHIIGKAKDQNGTIYYIVKNSWNTQNPYKGYIYVSRAYVEYKTMDIMVHKDAVPAKLRKKLNIK